MTRPIVLAMVQIRRLEDVIKKAALDLREVAHKSKDPQTAAEIWKVVGRLEKEGGSL